MRPPEFRTRFHRKPTKECWSLAASGFAPERVRDRTVLTTQECKTGIYSMLQPRGQLYPWGSCEPKAAGDATPVALGTIPVARKRARADACFPGQGMQDPATFRDYASLIPAKSCAAADLHR